METWSHSISKVREKMRHLDMLGMYAEAFDATMDEKSVVQIPYEPDDYWLGIPFPNGYDPENEKLSLVVLNLNQWNSNGIQTGLVIDEWVETIPNKEEMTGVAMHYDQPDAKPPQSVLVAVNPDEGENWTWDNLVYTLMDTAWN